MHSPNNFTPIYIANVNSGITKNEQNIHNANLNINNHTNSNVSYTANNVQNKIMNQSNGNKSIGYNTNNINNK